MQESKGALKVWLALEKLYLTEEATSQRVRNTNDSNSVKKSESDSYDMWEKRQLKAMGKLRKDLLKTLQALQLHFDVKVSMAEVMKNYGNTGHDYECWTRFHGEKWRMCG